MSLNKNLHISSFNCNSFKSSVEFINSLMDCSDIAFLQETWLMPDELSLPSLVRSDVDAFSISSVDTSSRLLVGRPYGGLTIMWKRSLG